jgi:hypothetical protein
LPFCQPMTGRWCAHQVGGFGQAVGHGWMSFPQASSPSPAVQHATRGFQTMMLRWLHAVTVFGDGENRPR